MLQAISCLTLALLFITTSVTNAQKGVEGMEGAEGGEVSVSVVSGEALSLECSLRVEQRATWRRDGGDIPPDLRAAAERPAAGRLVARLTAPRARPHHAGLYTCSDAPDRAAVRLRVLPAAAARPTARPAAAARPAQAAQLTVAGLEGVELSPVMYEVRGNLSLRCQLPNADSLPYIWQKNGTAVSNLTDLAQRHELKEGGVVFAIKGRASEEDYGTYSCHVGAGRQGWAVRARTHAKLPDNTNVVEGQKLKLQCKLIGKPYPGVEWEFNNATTGNTSLVREAFGARVQLRAWNNVSDAELELQAAQRGDAGAFSCRPLAPHAVADTTTLRVKDMYAALWPFIGICLEVAVLCAVILLYEKRRTKPELDDSDTDNHAAKKS